MSGAPVVHDLIPMAHAVDLERSTRFYGLLGFEVAGTHRAPDGALVWVKLRTGTAMLMLARASGPIDHEQQAVLFYLYARDVAAIRAHLLAAGVADGGRFTGAKVGDGCNLVFEVGQPFYMPAGELRVSDPDGYCLLIGQV